MIKGFVRKGELRRWALMAGVFLLILMCVAVEISMEGVCWDQKAAEAVKIGEAAGCLEFWVNRYQAFISAVIAFAAAAVAWIFTARQISVAKDTVSEMKRQSEFTSQARILTEAATIEHPKFIEDDLREFIMDYVQFRAITDENLGIGRIELNFSPSEPLPGELFRPVPSGEEIDTAINYSIDYNHRVNELIKRLNDFHYRATISGLIFETGHEITNLIGILRGVENATDCLRDLSRYTKEGERLDFRNRLIRRNYLRSIDVLRLPFVRTGYSDEYEDRLRRARDRMAVLDQTYYFSAAIRRPVSG